MADLPNPKVEVLDKGYVDGKQQIDVKIFRDDKGKKYEGKGSTSNEAIKDVIEQIIVDPHSLEWQKPVKKD
jgi:hypothetical protein